MHHKNPMVLGLLFAIWLAAEPLNVAAGGGQVVQQVSANGQRNLRPFTVQDKWEIAWDSKRPMLMIAVFNADGSMVGIAATQQGDGKGSSYQPKGGDYYLQVTGTGEWTVTVVQLP
jgi:hypothetical protein